MKNKPDVVKSIFSLLFPFIVFSVLLIGSCSKPAGTIGVNIQPDASKLKLKFSDTTTIYAYSQPIDSVYATNLTWNGLGSLHDPVFGITNAGFYTNFLLSENNPYFGTDAVLDSLVLQLYYYGVFADTNTSLTSHVFVLLEKIPVEVTSFFFNLQMKVYPTDYGNISFYPRPHDSVVVGEDTIPHILRLNLTNNNPALGEKLLVADSSAMEGSEKFWNYFAGLFVIAEPVNEGGCIAEFSLTSAYSYMTLYYHKDTIPLKYDYYLGIYSTRIEKYEHDFSYADPEFKQQVLEGDTALGNKNFYLQGLGGVKATVKMPFIKEWRKLGKIAINEAKLVFNLNEKEPYLGAPDQLFLYDLDEEGNTSYLIDYAGGENYFDGFYKSSSNNYTFRITRYLQAILNDTTLDHYGFSLIIHSPSTTPNRLILNGQDQQADSVASVKLNIIYTDLD